MTILAAIREQFHVAAFLRVGIMTVHTGQSPTLLIAAAAHQSPELIGGMRIVVVGIGGIQLDRQPLFERFPGLVGKGRTSRFPGSRVALSADFIGSLPRKVSQIDNLLWLSLIRELAVIANVITRRAMTAHARDSQQSLSFVVSID